LIVGQRVISARVSTRSARSSVVAWAAFILTLVRMRQFFRSARACSLAARSRLTRLFASFCARVSGFLRALRFPVTRGIARVKSDVPAGRSGVRI
jgi:hypothetical protein